MSFQVLNTFGHARRGELTTKTCTVQTPVFMPVGTYGTVKGLTPEHLHDIGFEIIIGNAFHLHQRPGRETIKKFNGLHDFMGWNKSILTDSGGYQVFSLGKEVKVNKDGAEYRSPFDGNKVMMTPEISIDVQTKINTDIMMAFDECIKYPSDISTTKRSMELSLAWAERSIKSNYLNKTLFGIIQGGMYQNLRDVSRDELIAMNFDGYALGGLSVGEPSQLMHEIIEENAPKLPQDKPRYVMGIGKPLDIAYAVRSGVDMFDCVMPTRNARNGQLFTSEGIINICLLYTSPSPRDVEESRMPSSA